MLEFFIDELSSTVCDRGFSPCRPTAVSRSQPLRSAPAASRVFAVCDQFWRGCKGSTLNCSKWN